MNVARILLRGAIRQTDNYYSYLIPESLEGSIVRGSLVKVPFGNGNRYHFGVVTEVIDAKEDAAALCGKLKAVDSLVNDTPVMTEEQMSLIEPLSKRFNCTKSDIVELFVPAFIQGHTVKQCDYIEIRDIGINI